jgi:hypothetical protein
MLTILLKVKKFPLPLPPFINLKIYYPESRCSHGASRLQLSGMCRVVPYMDTSVSEELTASIIRVEVLYLKGKIVWMYEDGAGTGG